MIRRGSVPRPEVEEMRLPEVFSHSGTDRVVVE